MQKYLVSMFNRVRQDSAEEMYRHFTTATDTKNIEEVFRGVKDTILTQNVQNTMGL